MDQTSQLQAIHFGSLSVGSIQPSKVICLIGMQEEAFPHREEDSSLYAGQIDYRPKRADEDRYLFLQAMLSAKEAFLISYVRDKEGKWGVSSIVQELLSHLKTSVVHHPAHSFDSQYFDGTFFSYNREQFAVAKAKKKDQRQPPLFKEFYESIIFQSPPIEEREIDVQKLFKFARHPLRYYFHEILGICPESSFSTQSEYLLDPLIKYHLVREALTTPLDTVLESAEKRGELPLNLLKPLAKEQLHKEIELWTTAMETFGIKKDELKTKKVDLQVGPYHLVGKLELVTPKGMLVKGKNSLEDRIRFYPQALILQSLGLPLLPINEQEPLIVEGSLEKYLDYFTLASKHPSPFLPKLAKAFLTGTEADLQKGFKQIDDEVWQWLLFRDGYPDASVIYRNWSNYLRAQFAGCVDAKV